MQISRQIDPLLLCPIRNNCLSAVIGSVMSDNNVHSWVLISRQLVFKLILKVYTDNKSSISAVQPINFVIIPLLSYFEM